MLFCIQKLSCGIRASNKLFYKCNGLCSAANDSPSPLSKILSITNKYTSKPTTDATIEFKNLQSIEDSKRKLDKLDIVELLVDVELEFGYVMSDEIADSIHTAEQAANWITKQQEASQ
eukprot:GHVL01041646.1.p1 GENE.GHVL01041646.1~~GHVL01041646.1.p1  ORF type:complete len:118 (+),score=15.87 GHVL01041646.1:16-369(+)